MIRLFKQTFILILISFSLNVYGQKYGNIWYFGVNAGINFNSCTPYAITNGQNPGKEGTATICDSIGNLLFYTNSDNVWNKQHVVMPNGILLNTSGTLSQVLIVKQPQSDSLYYIFTTIVQGQSGQSFQYHVVDMSLNSGLGGVISKNNILDTAITTEQVAATYHANGSDIWIVTHEYKTNNFVAFLLTGSGISTVPVISSCGTSQIQSSSNMNTRGEIKFSPDGTKIANNGNGVGTNDSTNILQLSDFDNATGIVSNPLQLPFMRGEFGLSFSPDNSKLYGDTWKAFSFNQSDSNYVYQFDLSSGVDSIIINSRTVLYATATTTNPFGSIKLGPDGKIYIAIKGSTYLAVIEQPNLPGIACNYQQLGFNLNGKTCWYGLNNYIEYVNYNYPPQVSMASSDSVFCEKNCVDFFDLTLNNPSSWQWFFPGADTATSTLQNPTNICYNNYGSYDVTLIACNPVCCDTLNYHNLIQCYPNPTDSIVSSNDTLYSLPALSYQWYETTSGIIAGATNQYYVATQQGSFYCIIVDSIGCVATSNTIAITGLTPGPSPGGEGSIVITPNPNDGNFEIILGNELRIANCQIQITDALGQIVFDQQVKTKNQKLTLNVDAGIYLLKLISQEFELTSRLIIKP